MLRDFIRHMVIGVVMLVIFGGIYALLLLIPGRDLW